MTTEINIADSTTEAWERLFEIANCCINWGESDIDKEKFFDLAKGIFIIKIVELPET